jgi:hypothetical protein
MAEDGISPRADARWMGLYRAAAGAAALTAALLVVEIGVYALLPRSETALEHLALLESDPVSGLLTLDLLGAVAYLLLIPTMLGLAVALRRAAPAMALIGTVLFFIGITVFFATNTALPALALSRQYAAATSEVERIAVLGAAEAMFALFNETAFLTSYLMVSVAWALVAAGMLRADAFNRWGASAGLLAGMSGVAAVILEHVSEHLVTPAIALYFAAIVFLFAWLGLVARDLHGLSRPGVRGEEADRRRLAALARGEVGT